MSCSGMYTRLLLQPLQNMCGYVCVYDVYVGVCVGMYVGVWVYVCMYVGVCVCVYVCGCMCGYVCGCVCMSFFFLKISKLVRLSEQRPLRDFLIICSLYRWLFVGVI